ENLATRPKLFPRIPWALLGIAVILLVGVLTLISRSNQMSPGVVPSITATSGGDQAAINPAQSPESTLPQAMTEGQLYFSDDFTITFESGKRADLMWPKSLNDPNLYENIENGVYHVTLKQLAKAATAIINPDRYYESGNQYDMEAEITSASQP